MLVFRFLRNLPTIPFSFQVYSFVTLLFLQFLRQLSGCLFVAMKFPVTFAILQTFLDFCKQFLLNIFLLKLRQKFVSKVFIQFAILVDFVIFAIFAIFLYSFLTVRLIFLLPKLRKQFATKFLLQCSILDIRGEPQGSHYATLSTISMKQIVQQLGKCGLNRMFW